MSYHRSSPLLKPEMNVSFIYLLTVVFLGHALLPLKQKCDKYGDTFGSWYKLGNLKHTDMITNNDSSKSSHFSDYKMGSALNFTKIWIPNNCSYQRFTIKTINISVHRLLENLRLKNQELPNDKVELIFLGDSALRGIFCGISRILSGSEIEGPNINTVCGGGTSIWKGQHEIHHPIAAPNFGRPYSVDFDDHLRLSFIYIKTFHFNHFDRIFESSIRRRPYAIIFNTGITYK